MAEFQEYRSNKENRFGWYVLCLCLPLSEVFIGGFIRVYEIGILLALISVFLKGRSGTFSHITMLDKMVFVYATYQIIVVLVGAENIYESARMYRYLVLGPVLVYFVIRVMPFSLKTVSRAHILMIAVVLVQTVLVILIYIEEGRRPKGVPHELIGNIVKYAFLVSYIFVLLVFSRRYIGTGKNRLLWLGALVVITAGMLAAASRGVTMPTLLMLLLTPWIWKSMRRRRFLGTAVSGFLILVIFIIAFAPPRFQVDESEKIDDARSVERIVSVVGYLADITDRVQFWAGMFDVAMEHPFLGHGAYSSSIKESGLDGKKGKRGGPTHSHNMIVSSAVTGGLPALMILVSLILTMYSLYGQMKADHHPREVFEKSFIVWSVVFLIVGLTNDIQGGVAILFFFMMGVMQQIVLHGRYASNAIMGDEAVTEVTKIESDSDRILQKAHAKGGNILSHKSER